MIKAVCKGCSKEFSYKKHRKHKGFYCSQPCFRNAFNYLSNTSQTVEERMRELFERYVIKRDGCWDWKGTKAKGYGQIMVFKKSMRAHRVSWILHNGPIPDGMLVCHRCDRPECTRPSCLFLGTHQMNVQDAYNKGRKHIFRGEEQKRSKLTDELVLEIKKLFKQPHNLCEIARQYKVSDSVIRSIKFGKTWKHIKEES